MNNKREVFSWVMYDWANSPFGSTVVTTFLGPYLTTLALAQGGMVNVLGFEVNGKGFFTLCVSISVFMQVLFLPVLGTLADYAPVKKYLMLTFAYIGAIATTLLFFIQGNLVAWGGLLFIVANLSFGASLVFYNAFLPDIASPDTRDTVSSQGFGFGYTGGGVLLVINILMVNFMADTALAVRLSLASAGLWWLFFTLIFPQRHLRQRQPTESLPAGSNYLSHSLKQFWASLKEMYQYYPKTLRFLIGYLIYNDGIQTVIVASGIFATTELGMGPETLVIVILFVQFVAAGGAWLFNLVAARIGAKNTIIINLLIWSASVIYAYGFLYTTTQFWILGFTTGLVLGSSQALSRSLFSQMIPENRESAYFGLYEISERGTSWLGPIVFTYAVNQTDSARIAILPIIAFFVFGMVMLYFTDVREAIRAAGNEVPQVV